MKIAFISTRGIPNLYGGFEQFAEIISAELVKRGHEVTVYNPSFHSYKEAKYKGVSVVKIYSPEKTLKTPANFIYDFLSLKHSIKAKHDILLVCGYTTASVSFNLFKYKKSKLVTNMDGLEWKRSKWSPTVQKMAAWFEKLAVKYSHHLISDNIGIQNYLKKKYTTSSTFIPYGATIFDSPDKTKIKKFELEENAYDVLMARMEPENNIEMVLEAFSEVNDNHQLVVVGSCENKYGKYIFEKFKSNERIKFLGWISNQDDLNNLRFFARFYFHGHSVGGTNPSLLEAMASGALIAAHENEFNRSVLEEGAVYFSSGNDIKLILQNAGETASRRKFFTDYNYSKIKNQYNWNTIVNQYENLFLQLINEAE